MNLTFVLYYVFSFFFFYIVLPVVNRRKHVVAPSSKNQLLYMQLYIFSVNATNTSNIFSNSTPIKIFLITRASVLP